MRPVIVTVKSIQRDVAGEDTTVELVSLGKYYEKGGAQYIRYNETEATGMDGVQTTIKLTPQSIVLIRTGTLTMRQEYVIGKTRETLYQTPFGDFDLVVHTHEYTNHIEDGIGQVHLGYDVSIDGEWQFYNQLVITVREDA